MIVRPGLKAEMSHQIEGDLWIQGTVQTSYAAHIVGKIEREIVAHSYDHDGYKKDNLKTQNTPQNRCFCVP